MGAGDSRSRPVFVETSPTPCGNGKSWSIFFQHQQLEIPFATEGVLVFSKMGREDKMSSCSASLQIVVQNCHLGVTQWKRPLRAATVGFSSFWDSQAVISTGRFVNPLVLLWVCCPNCQSAAASFTVMLWATVLRCIQTNRGSLLCSMPHKSPVIAVAVVWGRVWIGEARVAVGTC